MSSDPKPLTLKDKLFVFSFVAVIFLIALGAALFVAPYLVDAYHSSSDQATVTQDNTYLANGAWGDTTIQGTLLVHDLRNGFDYKVFPGCQYWKVGSNMTISVSWGSAAFGQPENHASVIILNAPFGCNAGAYQN